MSTTHQSISSEDVFNLALKHHNEGRPDQARQLYDILLESFPGEPTLLQNRGYLEFSRGNYELSRGDLEQALEKVTNSATLLLNLGAIYLHLKQYERAVLLLEASLQIDPNQAEAVSNLGESLRRLQRYEEAEPQLRKALQLAALSGLPGDRLNAIEFNLSLALHANGKKDEASELSLKVWRSEPSHLKYALSAAEKLALTCAWDELEQAKSVIYTLKTTPELIEDGIINAHYFSEFSQFELRQISEAYCLAAFSHYNPAELKRDQCSGHRHDTRIRIGYLLADVRNHANGLNTVLLFGKHDRRYFEVFVYSTGANDQSWVREQVVREAEHFVDLFSHTDISIAQRIFDDGINILVDLMGHTDMNRLGALAYRPAPIQMTWLGFPGTTGANFVDFVISDEIITPPENASGCTEKVVLLPHTYQINNLKSYNLKQTPPRSELGLPENAFVFCCLNNPNKLTRERFKSWMTILQACPNSVLWLYAGNEVARMNLRKESLRSGIEKSRLIFSAPKDREDYLAGMKAADLFLDTTPYGAHTTASDALWAGLPVLTTQGHTFASRVCASLVHAVKLPELVMPNESAYISQAIAWAHEPSALQVLREKLIATKASSPLFDTDLRVRELEAVYSKLWNEHRH